MPTPCLSCRSAAVRTLLDFGPQPPSNRFEYPETAQPERHPLVIGQCGACGLVQLVDPMPSNVVVPRFDWLTYNEPEGHLDDLVARLCGLPGLDEEARIVGLSYKDDTTLRRFNKRGYANTYRYDPTTDLGIEAETFGLETIQGALDAAAASRLVAQHGLADLLIVRHVLEHARDPLSFVAALRALVKPGGYLLFEMPDCTKFVKGCDYSFVWEEHVTYFSPDTFAAFVAEAGLAPQEIATYPYSLEDSLIGVIRNSAAPAAAPSRDYLAACLADGDAFARRFADVRTHLRSVLEAWRRAGRRTVVFGAGHLAIKFVNMHGLGEAVDCVIDDHARKQALLLPGSRLPIRGSAALEQADTCLLALSPESERKVVAKHGPFVDKGGRFLSIFALSPNSIYRASAR